MHDGAVTIEETAGVFSSAIFEILSQFSGETLPSPSLPDNNRAGVIGNVRRSNAVAPLPKREREQKQSRYRPHRNIKDLLRFGRHWMRLLPTLKASFLFPESDENQFRLPFLQEVAPTSFTNLIVLV